jgi:hypothetical protein
VRRLVLACVAALTTVGCGDSTLSGSLSSLFPLTVSDEVILRNSEAFEVTYLYNEPTAIDVVVSVGLSLTGISFIPGATIQLSGDYLPDHPQCTVVHHAAGEPEITLPNVSGGTLHLSSGGNPGDSTTGSFVMTFVNDGSYGGGRTLSGSFSGVAVDAGF